MEIDILFEFFKLDKINAYQLKGKDYGDAISTFIKSNSSFSKYNTPLKKWYDFKELKIDDLLSVFSGRVYCLLDLHKIVIFYLEISEFISFLENNKHCPIDIYLYDKEGNFVSYNGFSSCPRLIIKE